ncbi:MAG: tRNA (adenosine(37)-N6)-dimethylallyltransferase MiaA [Armatimonadetes bacterium]|nr:tRNA (adenosine(37)-N6)-dimethylallyltransferase MiaA [Armatimonadota bacterium]
MQKTVLGIVGPTATGKTAVGIRLARMLDGEIISADSMAVYRGMNIGTAKPTAEERRETAFHLIDVVDPDDGFSASQFKTLADEAIAGIMSRGRVPIVVGGTGMYIKVLTGGLDIPAVPPDQELRDRLRHTAERLGGECLLEQLREVDETTAARLNPRDVKRIIRALEVYKATGRPISHFHETAGSARTDVRFAVFGLVMDRAALYDRIGRRVDAMIEAGLVEEVRGLLDEGYAADLPAMKSLGYRQIAGFLLGKCELRTAVELIKQETRQFAKRQITWFRADPSVRWMDVGDLSPEEAARDIYSAFGRDALAQ